MRRLSVIAVAVLAPTLAAACGQKPGGPGGGDDGEPLPPSGWRLDVDLSGLDRFAPADRATWTVAGKATASAGLAGVDVAGASAAVTGDGAFTADAAIVPGLNPIAIVARDQAGHQRKASRSVLSARYLPAGAHDPAAASLVLTDAVVAAMAQGLAGQPPDLDVGGEIMSRSVLWQDSQCTTWPVQASQGAVQVNLELDGADLWLDIRIPDLYVYFEGECQGLLSTIPIGGEMGGTLDVWTELTAAPQAGATCLRSFAHATPQVEVAGWHFDVWGLSGPLQSWLVQLFSGSKSAQARDQLATEVGARADQLLGQRLGDVAVFDRTSQLALLGQPIAMHLCVSDLVRSGQRLIARVAASAQGAGEAARPAPGAPLDDGAVPAAAPGELLLDDNLVAQLLFAAWQGGGLARPSIEQVDLELLALVAPDLSSHFAPGTKVDVSLDGELPPLVRATPGGAAGAGDLRVEIGDLMLDLSVGDERLYRIGAVVTLDLDLVAMDGKLVPTVVASQATATVLDARYETHEDLLETVIAGKITDQAQALLAGAAIALPDLPGLGAPQDVTADPGGRFLHVRVQ